MATKTKQEKPAFIDYSKKGEKAQKVPGFEGKDKATLYAKSALAISRYLTVNKKQEAFTAMDAKNVVLEQTQVDLASFYPGSSYSDCPLHKGLHALSKPETNEVVKDEKGNETDSEARGKRGILQKDGKVGLQQNGKYYRNTGKSYAEFFKKISPDELKTACQAIVDNSRAKK